MEYKTYLCDHCGDSFEAPAKRVYESSDIVFCRKRCYQKYMDEWGDEANGELLQALPGEYFFIADLLLQKAKDTFWRNTNDKQ